MNEKHRHIVSSLLMVIFSLPLIYQPVHRVQHLSAGESTEECCSHHAPCHGDFPANSELSLDEEHEHCFICEYEFVSIFLPDKVVPFTGIVLEQRVIRLPVHENVLNYYYHLPSLRAPPLV